MNSITSTSSSSSSAVSAEELEELQKLQALQETMRKEWSPTVEDQQEIDGRSVYVGNVDYGVQPRGLEAHFKECGAVKRVSIPTDRSKRPKGFGYVEFETKEGMQKALLQSGSVLAGRRIKVVEKRTNKPGFSQTGHAATSRQREVVVKYVYVQREAPRGKVAGTFRNRPSYKPY